MTGPRHPRRSTDDQPPERVNDAARRLLTLLEHGPDAQVVGEVRAVVARIETIARKKLRGQQSKQG